MSVLCPQTSSGSNASVKTLDDFINTDNHPNTRCFCPNCGFTAFLNYTKPLDNCCPKANGLDTFTCVILRDNGSVLTTFSSSTTSLRPETDEEVELVGKLRSYFKSCNKSSTPEERLLMLNSFRDLHYKSFWGAFKENNPGSSITVQDFRAMFEKL